MITTSDIGDILFLHLSGLSVKDVRRDGNLHPRGELTEERVTLKVKPITAGKPWSKAYVEVNILVPDMEDGQADLIRLSELEAEYVAAFGWNTSTRGGIRYRFGRESVGLMDDGQLRCHYVNIRVLFEFLNLIEQWQRN